MFAKHGTVTDCRLLKDKNGKSRRIAYVGYKSITEANQALKVSLAYTKIWGKTDTRNGSELSKLQKLNGTTIGISKLGVERCKELKQLLTEQPEKKKKKKEFLSDKVDPDLVDSDDENVETKDDKLEKIADSGRLFVRNLSYLASESDLKTAFEIYGTLTELVLPLDEETQKPKVGCPRRNQTKMLTFDG